MSVPFGAYLAPAAVVVAAATASAMTPPDPLDVTVWCERNVEFDDRSPIPGKFDIDRFPWLKEIHEKLSDLDPAREISVRGSAQVGKTVSIINPFIGAWHEYTSVDSLVVHPTTPAAEEWVRNKLNPMRTLAPSLRRTFGKPGTHRLQTDTTKNIDALAGNGSLKIASAGSPADLTGTTRRIVALDDLAKFDQTEKGDPENLAESRASGFDDAKILRISTALLKGTCRITRAYERGDQREYRVPCPECGHKFALTWDNFLENLDPENLAAACFSCPSCDRKLKHSEKARLMRLGEWIATNPNGDHPSYHIWRAYSPLRDWASIAKEWAKLRGWTRVDGRVHTTERADQVEAESEQVFWNDVLGLPFETANGAPDWEALRDRVENADPDDLHVLPLGVLPATGVLVTAGVDCQDDRTEVTVKAFGKRRQSWAVEHIVIPYHISTDDARKSLNAILKRTWRTELGQELTLDCLAIDGGTYTDDVWSWAKTHPAVRVIVVKGASSQNGPLMIPMKFDRKKDGQLRRRQKRGYMLNVSSMKATLYTWLAQDDPAERGYMNFAAGLGDEFYRQQCSEVRTLTRLRTGVTVASWDLVEPSRRNEVLDCTLYAQGAALRHGWASRTDAQWDDLAAARGKTVEVELDDQGDLFEAADPLAEVEGEAHAVADPAAIARAAKRRKLRGILKK